MSRYLTRRETNLLLILLILIFIICTFSFNSYLRYRECNNALGDLPICYKYAIKGDL